MKFTARIVIVALLAALFVAPTNAADKKKSGHGKKKGRTPAGLFSPAVQKAVPGIDAAVNLSKEQQQQIAALRKKIMGSDKLVGLRKKMKNGGASKEDKKAVREAYQEAQAELNTKTSAIVSKDQSTLIAQINAAAKKVQSSLRSEYHQKFKDAKGDEDARKILLKGIATKSKAQLSAAIVSLLSAEQKEAVKAAAKQRGKKVKGEKKKKKKKDAA